MIHRTPAEKRRHDRLADFLELRERLLEVPCRGCGQPAGQPCTTRDGSELQAPAHHHRFTDTTQEAGNDERR